MLTQEDFYGAFQKLLEWYNKCIAAGGDYFEGDYSFVCVLSIKVPIRKKSGNLFNDLRIMKIINNQLDIKLGQFTQEELNVVLIKIRSRKTAQPQWYIPRNIEDKEIW